MARTPPRLLYPIRAVALIGVLAAWGCGHSQDEVPRTRFAEDASDHWRIHLAESTDDESAEMMLTRLSASSQQREALPARLVLACIDERLQVYIEWDTDLGQAPIPVRVQVDQEPAREGYWQPSGDGDAAGLWTDSTSLPLLHGLIGRDTLFVQVHPEGVLPRQATFALSGLDSLAVPMQQMCTSP